MVDVVQDGPDWVLEPPPDSVVLVLVVVVRVVHHPAVSREPGLVRARDVAVEDSRNAAESLRHLHELGVVILFDNHPSDRQKKKKTVPWLSSSRSD